MCVLCAEWTFGKGQVTEAMLKEHLPAPAADTVVLLCGPPGLVNETCLPALERLKHAKDHLFAY